MKRIVIIGAGSQGRDIAEIITHPLYSENVEFVGFIDEDRGLHDRLIDGHKVLGNWNWFADKDLTKIEVICGSGVSETRKKMAEKAISRGLKFTNVISPNAYLPEDAEIGRGNFIGHGAVICRGVRVKDHILINYGARVGHDNRIDDFVTINPNVALAGHVFLKEGAFIGIGANVIQGISIGKWTVIGAGATVIKDVPEYVTAVGVPAEIIKRRYENDR
jgi:sugar O-acyltransferase (sialic acid O-acetyltransferase NeuD family)